MAGDAGKLTPKEERFVEEYLSDADLNATAAYRRAFPRATYGTARSESARLLAKPSIRARIRAGRRRLSRRAGVTAERIVRELARLAFSDIGDVIDFGPGGRVALRPTIPAEARKAIASLRIKRLRAPSGQPPAELIEFKLYDKLAALEKLGRHLGLFEELPPLEVLLGALPRDVADAVRKAIAPLVQPEQTPGGAGGRPVVRVGGEADTGSV